MTEYDMVVLKRRDGGKIEGNIFDIDFDVGKAVCEGGYGHVKKLGVHVEDYQVVVPVIHRRIPRGDMDKIFEKTEYIVSRVYTENIERHKPELIEICEDEGLIIISPQ